MLSQKRTKLRLIKAVVAVVVIIAFVSVLNGYHQQQQQIDDLQNQIHQLDRQLGQTRPKPKVLGAQQTSRHSTTQSMVVDSSTQTSPAVSQTSSTTDSQTSSDQTGLPKRSKTNDSAKRNESKPPQSNGGQSAPLICALGLVCI